MFLGEFEHLLDDKGRLTVPAKFRMELVDGFVITKGIDRCLFVYTLDEWRPLAEKISRLPVTKREARALARLVFAGASDCSLDKQGRILLPSYLRQYANLNSEVVIVGLNTHLEIWDLETWRNTSQKIEEEAESIAEQLGGLI